MYIYIYTCHTLHDTSNIVKLMYYHNTTNNRYLLYTFIPYTVFLIVRTVLYLEYSTVLLSF
jgi:hypothetical protein